MKEEYILIAKDILSDLHVTISLEDFNQEIELCILEMKHKNLESLKDFRNEFLKRLQIILGLNKQDLRFAFYNRFFLKNMSLPNFAVLSASCGFTPQEYEYLIGLWQVCNNDFEELKKAHSKEDECLDNVTNQTDLALWFKKANIGNNERHILLSMALDETNVTKLSKEMGYTRYSVEKKLFLAKNILLKTEPFATEFEMTRKKEEPFERILKMCK